MHTFFFSIRVFFTDTDDSQESRGREGTIFYSTVPLPPAHKHRDIYLQLCIWYDYHIFLVATLVFTRLLLVEWLVDDAMFVCLLDELCILNQNGNKANSIFNKNDLSYFNDVCIVHMFSVDVWNDNKHFNVIISENFDSVWTIKLKAFDFNNQIILILHLLNVMEPLNFWLYFQIA